MTGIVGAAGGLGGFFLPNLLGTLKKLTGSFGPGFLSFALTGIVCAGALLMLRTAWERSFLGKGGKAISESVPASDPGVVGVPGGELVPVGSAAN